MTEALTFESAMPQDPTHEGNTNEEAVLNKECLFLRLPAELRIQIYEYLLLDSDAFVLLANKWQPLRQHRTKPLYPAILSTCQFFHREASAVLYGCNMFRVLTWPLKWCRSELIKSIGYVNASKIRKVFCTLGVDYRIDQNAIKQKYSTLGIDFSGLHIWALLVPKDTPLEKSIEKDETAWLSRLDLEDPQGLRQARRLGLNPLWLVGSCWYVRRVA
ncbi:hypothetical protein AOQ84DRAFT_421827 [Glonium stellatum]|uniref:F-box domain-containing protein n=1 Tax=Glonium stellatum TaxID=574774 RepID=A0A8E2EPY6_9PEZI|nr:hypothetical protein AOQ84DRAFT_421827 [Glonium stellatum]